MADEGMAPRLGKFVGGVLVILTLAVAVMLVVKFGLWLFGIA